MSSMKSMKIFTEIKAPRIYELHEDNVFCDLRAMRIYEVDEDNSSHGIHGSHSSHPIAHNTMYNHENI